MTLSVLCEQVYAVVQAWPVITKEEFFMYLTFGVTAARMARAWVRA